MDTETGKRKYVRVNDEFSVRVVQKDDAYRRGIHEIKTTRSINVSASGILINSSEPLKIDSIVNISFIKPNTFDFFRGAGRVVRVEKNKDGTYRIAIQFINLNEKDMKELDYYLRLGKK